MERARRVDPSPVDSYPDLMESLQPAADRSESTSGGLRSSEERERSNTRSASEASRGARAVPHRAASLPSGALARAAGALLSVVGPHGIDRSRQRLLFLARCILLTTLLSLSAACLLSEQIGERPEDIVLSYDTGLNRLILFGRSALIVAAAIWIVSAWKKSVVALFLSGSLVLAAGWLVERDHSAISGYKLELTGLALVLDLPPEPRREIVWNSIVELSVGGGTFEKATRNLILDTTDACGELSDWQSISLRLRDGARLTVDLFELSAEQRHFVCNAIVKRAGLREVD